jgi:hypothetical protein
MLMLVDMHRSNTSNTPSRVATRNSTLNRVAILSSISRATRNNNNPTATKATARPHLRARLHPYVHMSSFGCRGPSSDDALLPLLQEPFGMHLLIMR